MTAASALAAGRVAARRQMTDTVRVSSIGEPVTDPDTGDVTTPETPLYTGPGKVQTYEPYERNPEAGGATFTVQRYSVHVPVGAFEPRIGQVVDVVEALHDPHLTGRRFRVVALLHKSMATAYRLAVEEVSA